MKMFSWEDLELQTCNFSEFGCCGFQNVVRGMIFTAASTLICLKLIWHPAQTPGSLFSPHYWLPLVDCPSQPEFCCLSYIPALPLYLILRTPAFEHIPFFLNTPGALLRLETISQAPVLSYGAFMEVPGVLLPPLGFTHLFMAGTYRIVSHLVTCIRL